MVQRGWKQRIHERISRNGNKFKAGSVVVRDGNSVAIYKPEFIEAMKKPITKIPKKDYSDIIKGSSMAEQMGEIQAYEVRNKKLIDGMSVRPTIGTVAGEARYIGTELEDENGRWNDHYETVMGYWVIHRYKAHHVYKI